jgi:hemolysin D
MSATPTNPQAATDPADAATRASAVNGTPQPNANSMQQPGAKVIPLRPPSRWHDPLQLIQNEPPSQIGRIVLWSVSVLILILIAWATFGQLDIIATAEGKLVPQTLVKIVQPAEPGVVRQLLVKEGDHVTSGQVLARLDTTLATADKTGIAVDLATQQMQVRRLEAQLKEQPMLPKAGDDPVLYAQVQSQYTAHRKAFLDSLDQEKSLLTKAEHERKSATEILNKLEQTLPTYKKSADAYAKLEKEGFIAGIAAADKQREAIEKTKDLDAQRATVAALHATIAAQQKKINQLHSAYKNELQKELADVRAKIAQLQPNLNKSIYREGLMELKAPQDGVIKDLATTTVGAVVQPGTVILTLVPQGEQLYADVQIRNDDVGFVQIGQRAQIKLAAYPFQKYGMVNGKVIHISADATEVNPSNKLTNTANDKSDRTAAAMSTYKARIQLDQQTLAGPRGGNLMLAPGMQITAEIHQGKRTVMEYLLSPVQKAVSEVGRER